MNEEMIRFRYLPDLRGILLDLKDQVEARKMAKSTAEPTKIEPFQLTAPKPRLVPIPKIVRRFSRVFLSSSNQRCKTLDSENGKISTSSKNDLRTIA